MTESGKHIKMLRETLRPSPSLLVKAAPELFDAGYRVEDREKLIREFSLSEDDADIILNWIEFFENYNAARP